MTLEFGVAAAVLLAGALHAGWNTLVKTGGDRTATFVLIMLGAGLAWLPVGLLRGLPDPASWPFLAASVFIHLFYSAFLLAAYRHGDLSQVYPIARGSAPALVAIGAWLLAGEALTVAQSAGVAVVCLGILSLAWRRRDRRTEGHGVVFALLTGMTIGGYVLSDGLGVRRAGDPLTYIAWLFVLQGLALVPFGLWLRRGALGAAWRSSWLSGLCGGVIASLSYGIAVWAMGLGPMAHVTALRETSVLIAALIGTRLLGEPFGARRVVAAAMVAGGAVTLQLAGAG
ncbi:MAG: EamA family transporter [Halofilum sp. (in: g-proteobacteria)]|nr:EamA family transporter [Halofilum sp. (in: g-proteobacteria)]